MAGSDGFQRELNRSAQPAGTQDSSVKGDFSIQPVEGSQQPYGTTTGAVGGSTGTSGSFDYSMLNQQQSNDFPSGIQGPGGFDKQVEREKYLQDNNIAQGGDSTWGFAQKGVDFLKDNPTDNDGTSIAMKYIQQAAKTNPINIEALDHSIRMRPLYHEAKSKLEGLKTFGDTARWSREALPDFKMPTPMGPSDKADIKGIAGEYSDKIDDLKL